VKFFLGCTIAALIGVILAKCAVGQDYRVSKPDSFGARYVSGPNGFKGKISGPDSFGTQYFRYSNGVSGKISGSDSFGSRVIRLNKPTTSPIRR